MFSFKSLITISLMSASGIMHTLGAPTSQSDCVIPAAGNYSLESFGLPGELLGVGQPNVDGFTLVLEKAPPQGNLGVWTFTNAAEAGFTLTNVELGRNVTTLHLVESNLFIPLLPVPGTPGYDYAVQCAGNGQYVIKAVDADLLWTIIPGTREGDAEQGVAFMELLPANGSNEQLWLLRAT